MAMAGRRLRGSERFGTLFSVAPASDRQIPPLNVFVFLKRLNAAFISDPPFVDDVAPVGNAEGEPGVLLGHENRYACTVSGNGLHGIVF